jgi:hypothetical protein
MGTEMKTKIISTVIIYSLLIQIALISPGCMSTFPINGGNEPANYRDYKNKISIVLKDRNEVEVYPKNLYYVPADSEFIYGEGDEYSYLPEAYRKFTAFKGIISPAAIDSEAVVNSNSTIYHIIYIKDIKRLSIAAKDLARFR